MASVIDSINGGSIFLIVEYFRRGCEWLSRLRLIFTNLCTKTVK